MRKLSCWAREHALAAQLLIFICHVLLILDAVYLAVHFSAFTSVSPVVLYCLAGLLLFLFIIYPRRLSRFNYARRKAMDVCAGLLCFSMVFVMALQLNRPSGMQQNPAYAVLTGEIPVYKNAEAQRLLQLFASGEKTSFSRKEKQILKKEFGFQLIQYGKAHARGDKGTADQTGLIILAIIGAVGLLFLVASLACTLSCNGADAAAVLVVIFGVAGIIWGLSTVIKSIKRKRAAAPA